MGKEIFQSARIYCIIWVSNCSKKRERFTNIRGGRVWKKRILSVLLSMVVATTISSAVPMNVQAETTAVKTAV